MKILLAGPRGFCAGVNMAIDTLDLAIQLYGTPIYVITRSSRPARCRSFRGRGPLRRTGQCRRIAASSPRGISPEVRRGTRAAAIDGVYLIRCISKFRLRGVTRFAVGHEVHDRSSAREAPRPSCSSTPEQVDRLDFPADTKLAYLTQTTLSVDDANRIIGRLKERFPEIVGPPKEDICYATQNRQEAVRRLAREADIALVLGRQNSSNSQRLAELAAETGVRAHLIDGAAHMDLAWFHGDETVLITAGASGDRLSKSALACCESRATVERSIRDEVYSRPGAAPESESMAGRGCRGCGFPGARGPPTHLPGSIDRRVGQRRPRRMCPWGNGFPASGGHWAPSPMKRPQAIVSMIGKWRSAVGHVPIVSSTESVGVPTVSSPLIASRTRT
jgi:4-hydroxy-3-methylbut-2-enyl diphosphate reductase